MSVRRRAVADELGEWFRAARQRVAQFLDDQNAGSPTHDETVPRGVEGPRGAIRCFVEPGGQGTGGGKTTETDDIHAGFGSAAQGDVGFIGADETRRITDRLDAGRTSRYWRAERTFEALADRDLTCCEIDQEGRYCERRQAADAAPVDRTHCFGNGGESADA